MRWIRFADGMWVFGVGWWDGAIEVFLGPGLLRVGRDLGGEDG